MVKCESDQTNSRVKIDEDTAYGMEGCCKLQDHVCLPPNCKSRYQDGH
jgi:hypothetical protein